MPLFILHSRSLCDTALLLHAMHIPHCDQVAGGGNTGAAASVLSMAAAQVGWHRVRRHGILCGLAWHGGCLG